MLRRKQRTELPFLVLIWMVAVALACNYTSLTPPAPSSTPVTPSPNPLSTTPVEAATVTPTFTPTPTISACSDNAAGRTEGCDEFNPQFEAVGRFDGAGVPAATCQGWCQLVEGDTLETDSFGQAELNFSACWPGRLYLYQSSVAQALVSACTKTDFCPGGNCENPPAVCVPNGALYADQCASEFNPVTGSTRIEKTSASYLITYNKDAGGVTTIVVTDGVVRLRPVMQSDPIRLGEEMEVRSGEFLFTMPDESLQGVGGLEPRVPHPVEKLPEMVQELGLEDWVIQAAEKAREGGYLPENWPSELSGRGMIAQAGGGRLADQGVQLAVYRAINWSDLPVSDRLMRLAVADKLINAFDISYEPAQSEKFLSAEEMVVQLVFPAQDAELEKTAKVVAEYLVRAGVLVEIVPVNPQELAALIREFEASKRPYLLLRR